MKSWIYGRKRWYLSFGEDEIKETYNLMEVDKCYYFQDVYMKDNRIDKWALQKKLKKGWCIQIVKLLGARVIMLLKLYVVV